MISKIANNGVTGLSTTRHWLIAMLLACNLGMSSGAYGELTTDFFVFPSITATHRSQSPSAHGIERDDFIPAADLFFTADYRDFRVLAELFGEIDGTHGTHLERFQVGWLPNSDLAVWLGRFHNPLGFWNTAYHHGGYLQTSVSRPAIIAFEHDRGILPIHISGLLVEKTINTAHSSWHYAIGLGAGPHLKEHLEAVDLPKLTDDPTKLVASFRLSWQPAKASDNQLGVFISSATIPSKRLEIEKLKQQVGGIYTDWHFRAMRITGALFSVTSNIKQSNEHTKGSFINSYVQLESPWDSNWIPYGRLEKSMSDEADPYLNHMHNFIRDRELIGIRFDMTRHQSLKLEISEVHLAASNYSQATLQWSAVFP